MYQHQRPRVAANQRRSIHRRRRQRNRLTCQLRPTVEKLEDRRLLTAELISVTPAPVLTPGEAGNDYSTNAVINADGRFIAFQSHASNLVDTDSNATQDVFVRDLALGTTTLLSINADNSDSGDCPGSFCSASLTSGSFDPAISDDGRYVAFVSHATDLVKDVTIDVTPNVFVRDRDADEDGVFDELGEGETTTTLISIGTDGTAAGILSGPATRPVISGNGAFVVFASSAPDVLVDDLTIVDTNGTGADVYRASVEGGAVTRINVDGSGLGTGFGSGSVSDFSISSTGAVTFVATNAGLVSAATGTFDDTNGSPDLFLGSGNSPVTLISANALGSGPGDSGSREGMISRDGRHVAFFSSATDLVSGATDANLVEDLFVRDLKTAVTSLVSRSSAAGPLTTGDGATPPSTLLDSDLSAGPALSDNGRFIVYRTAADDLVDIDTNSVTDIVLYDRDTDGDGVFDEPGATANRLVSINVAGTASADHAGSGPGTAGSSHPTISGDGRFVAFSSTGRDLIDGGTPFPGGHVYVRDMLAGITSQLSETFTGVGVGPEGTTPPTRPVAMSRDGTRVAFQTDVPADDLDASVTDPAGGSPVPFGEIDIFAAAPDPDIVLGRNFATGDTEFAQSFRIRFDDVPEFDVGYYRSTDDVFDESDELLGTAAVTDPDDLRVDGNRFVSVTIGTDSGAIAFPGVGSDDPLEDYFILTVGDPEDEVREFDAVAFNEDNTRALRGLYKVTGEAASPVFVHGSPRDERITSSLDAGTLTVDYGTTGFDLPGEFPYDVADVTAVHVRTHDGDDTVIGSELSDVVFGGPGSDTLEGNDGDDSLFGGPDKDSLDGGDGADTLDGGPGPDIIIGGPGPDTIFDGPGDDIVDVGDGDDTVFATPGSHDEFTDTGGVDTLDFSLASLPITIDLDSSAVQTVDSDGNTIRLIGDWENYVGSPLDDDSTTHVRPRTFARNLDGGDGFDSLIVDGLGLIVTNDGTTLNFPGSGLGPITYHNFENVRVINALPPTQIIDNGSFGFTSQGFTLIDDPANPQGLGGDLAFASNLDPEASSATWTFNNIPSGHYVVSANWGPGARDRATDAPYRLLPDGIFSEEVRVNQELEAQEFADAGVTWENLGIVRVFGNSLIVELTDDANDFVLCDAVRIELLDHVPILVDDVPIQTPVSVGDPVVFRRASPSVGAIGDTINDFRLELGGNNNLDAGGPIGGGRREINFEEVPDGLSNDLFSDFYDELRPRGAVLQTDGILRVSGSGAPGFPAEYEDLNSTYPIAFRTFSDPKLFTPLGSNVTEVRFLVPATGIPAAVRGFGAVFSDVDTSFTSKIQYFDAAGEQIAAEFVDPSAGNGGLSFLGVAFDSPLIARVLITSGEAPIMVDGPNDITQGGVSDLVVMDDFIYGEPVAINPAVGIEDFQSDCLAISGPGFLGDQHSCLPGEASTWTFHEVSSGSYLVSTTWEATFARSNPVGYTIDDTVEIPVNQQNPPDDFQFAGRFWDNLAKIVIDDERTAPLSITVTGPSQPFGTTIADAVQLVPTPDLVFFDPFENAVINNDTVDLGEIPLNVDGTADVFRPLRIENRGLAPLVIENLAVTGIGLQFNPLESEDVPMGGSSSFELNVTGTGAGPFSGQITFNSNDFDHPQMTVNVIGSFVEDAVPPTITIVEPDDNTVVIEGTSIDIGGLTTGCAGQGESCTVTFEGQTVTVNPDGTFMFHDFPINLEGRQLPIDNQLFRVRATDQSGNEAETEFVLSIVADEPPKINLQSPIQGQSVIAGSTIPIVFDAIDDVQVVKVELLVNGQVQSESVFAPFPLQAEIPSDAGDHAIQVCATDSGDNVSCAQVTVNAFLPPVNRFGDLIIGADQAPRARVFDTDGNNPFPLTPFPGSTGVRVATGDVNGDGVPEVIVGAGPGGGPHVKVIDAASGQTLSSFFAFDAALNSGIFVAAGDVTGDGRADLIVGAGPGGGPHVKVFDGVTGDVVAAFTAYDPAFTEGVRVAAGDVNGDGQSEIITAPGPGGGPHVRVFDGHTASQIPNDGTFPAGSILFEFRAFDEGFTGGLFVAAGDLDGDGLSDPIIGADVGGSVEGGHVRAVSAVLLPDILPLSVLAEEDTLVDFFAFPGFAGGARVASSDVNNDGFDDIITTAGPGLSTLKIFDGTNENLLDEVDLGPEFIGAAVASADQPIVAVVNVRGDTPITLVERDGGDVVVRDGNGGELFRRTGDDPNTIRVNAPADNDDLFVVRTIGTDLMSPIVFDGGLGGFDAVRFEPAPSGTTLNYVRVEFKSILTTAYSSNRNDPNDFDFLGVDLEPIDDLLEVVDREFVFAGTDDQVVYDTGNDDGDSLLRIDSDNSEVIDFQLPTGTITVNLGDGSDVFVFDLPVSLLPSVDGGDGVDSFVLGGSERHLDLTDPTQNLPQNIEVIDIVGASPNTLTLDGQSVIDTTDVADTLSVIHDEDDTVNYDGDGWIVGDPIFVDGGQRHVLTNGAARVETINTRPFQNPLDRFDVSFRDGVTSLDALQVINFLGRNPGISVDVGPPSDASELPDRYYDVNGSNTVTALDALQVINFLGRIRGESELVTLSNHRLIAPPANLPLSDASDSESLDVVRPNRTLRSAPVLRPQNWIPNEFIEPTTDDGAPDERGQEELQAIDEALSDLFPSNELK